MLNQLKKDFALHLLAWLEKNDRPMPWKGERNPYYIWLSEIILQQTRVAQGLPYFERFKAAYPQVADLANAPQDEVMKLWEGLGYYSRARNLHFTAKHITDELDGVFPNTYEEILTLKGVGPYTAAAIASFAFDIPKAVVDGNVYRVLSRIFGIRTPIDSTAGKKEFAQLADELIAKDKPASYNQAIMDFGATQCTPANPSCSTCPFAEYCIAYTQKVITKLPVKEKKIKKRNRYFNFLVIQKEDESVLLQKRTQKDIWLNLYQFPLLETTEQKDDYAALQIKGDGIPWEDFTLIKQSKPYKQLLTHQKIIAHFWVVKVKNDFESNLLETQWVSKNAVSNYAFPKVIDLYLQDKDLYLELF